MFKNILKIFTGTFISRIIGFIREIIVASFFGTGKVADAFTLALIFPNLFRQILGEDMVERAFMPPFKSIYDRGGKAQSWKFISVVFNWFFIILMITTFVLYLIIPLIFSLRGSFPDLFGNVFSNNDFDYELTLKLILILLPFTIFIGLAAFIGSILNFFEKNWIFGLAPAMLSVGVIAGIYVLYPYIGGYSIAVGYVFGAFLQMAIQIPFLYNRKFKNETDLKYHTVLKDPEQDYKVLKRESRFITLNAALDKTQEVFGRFFASTLLQGSTSSLFYAIRLFQLPFAILSLPITRGINPELNRLKANENYQAFNHVYSKGLNLYLLMFFPISVILVCCSPEIIDIVYRRGHFDASSLHLTSLAFSMYSLGLLPMSLVGYYKRVLSLFNKNKYALYISLISAILNILFALVFVKFTPMGHEGIALASSLAFFVNMWVMHNYTRKELKAFIRESQFKVVVNIIMLCLLSAIIIAFTFYFGLEFYKNKIQSVISITAKSGIIFTIFILFYLLNKNLRPIFKGFFIRNKGNI